MIFLELRLSMNPNCSWLVAEPFEYWKISDQNWIRGHRKPRCYQRRLSVNWRSHRSFETNFVNTYFRIQYSRDLALGGYSARHTIRQKSVFGCLGLRAIRLVSDGRQQPQGWSIGRWLGIILAIILGSRWSFPFSWLNDFGIFSVNYGLKSDLKIGFSILIIRSNCFYF